MKPSAVQSMRRQRGPRAPELRPAAKAAFATAMQHFRAGQLAEAAELYRHVLVSTPCHADSLHLLGLVAQQQGRTDVAIALIRQAITINGKAASFHCNLGNLLLENRQLADAMACFHKALDLDPRLVEAHVSLAEALSEVGQGDEAVRHFQLALGVKPDLPLLHNNLGDALRRQGRLDHAVASCRKALQLDPNYPDAYVNLGATLMVLQRHDEAVACFRNALELRPDFVAAQLNLGSALVQQKLPDEAVFWFLKAIALQPEHADSYNNLGNALMELAKAKEATSCFVWALTLNPNYYDAHINLSEALRCQNRLDESLVHARRAEALAPERIETLGNLGATYRAQGRLDDAIASFKWAIDRAPSSRLLPQTHADLGMALLARGDLTVGWEEFEWRTQIADLRRDFDVPKWRGEAAAGKTLLIHAEQGFGDTLQFCRYAPLAAERGLRVILEVEKPLVRLLRSLPGIAQVMTRGETLPDFDLYCPMMSLPLAFRTRLETIPTVASYLHPNASRVAEWEERLANGQGPRVGVLWAGNPRNHMPRLALVDRRRSMAPERLAPVFDVPGVQFFCLQKDGPRAPDGFPVTDFMSEMADFADTAALIGTLDLVIAVDSAVAHLAGALGRPVWLMDRFDPCWRWLLDRDDSPWYPGLSIFRQSTPGDWDPVVARIANELRSLAAAWNEPVRAGATP